MYKTSRTRQRHALQTPVTVKGYKKWVDELMEKDAASNGYYINILDTCNVICFIQFINDTTYLLKDRIPVYERLNMHE